MSIAPPRSIRPPKVERFPDEDLPEGAVVDGALLRRDVDASVDYVVVGSGASGAVAAYTLARAGYEVAIVEEGPWVRTRDFGVDVATAFRRMMREAGTQVIAGRSYIPMLQGRCVGGSTVVNSAIAWRVPEDVLADWSTRFGLGDAVTMEALAPHYDALEEALNVRPVRDDVLGENSRLFLETAARAGIEASPMRRYERGCTGSGRCLTGCPSAAKQGMSVTYVPWTLAHGGRIFASCRVEHVVIAGGRAVGVVAHGARAVRLRARRGVVIAASTVQTPNLLRRSGLRGKALGNHFQAHPGVGLGGVFDHPINMQFGATQAAESLRFRHLDSFKPETISMQPELAAVRVPGVGHELVRRLGSYANVAVWAVQMRARAEGTVRPPWLGGEGDAVRYSLGEGDVRIARNACGVLARLMFKAGAREVWPGIHGVPAVLRHVDDVATIDNGPLDARAYSFVTTHLFGAARMGRDPRASVVGPHFETHAVERLYVVDSSVFPTNLGVNPQHTIMAMSRLAATRIAALGLRVAA